MAPLSSVNNVVVWLFISGWTMNAASTYHLNSWEFASKVSISSLVFLRKFITQSSFFQSSSFDSLTLEDKIEIAWYTSGWPRLLKNIAFVSKIWMIFLCSSLNVWQTCKYSIVSQSMVLGFQLIRELFKHRINIVSHVNFQKLHGLNNLGSVLDKHLVFREPM